MDSDSILSFLSASLLLILTVLNTNVHAKNLQDWFGLYCDVSANKYYYYSVVVVGPKTDTWFELFFI